MSCPFKRLRAVSGYDDALVALGRGTMRFEDVKPGRWVIYTARHPRFGDTDRIGQIGRIKGWCLPLETDEPNLLTNVSVDWLTGLNVNKSGGGVYQENIELLGSVEAYEEGEEHGNR